jgi:hypothetical protein
MVIKPVDPVKGNGVLLFEVVNRGNILLLNKFNSAASSRNPTTPDEFGNGYLMREGYTLVFVGWEFDLAPGRLRVEAPKIDGLIEAITVPFILDSVWAHIAGSARGTFNQRFGMPISASVLLTPTRFPFTTDEQEFHGERGSLLQLYKPVSARLT